MKQSRRKAKPAQASQRPAAALGSLEALVALAATGLSVLLHGIFLLNAGGLWRDEANTFRVATTAGWARVREAMVFEPFPALYLAVVRFWSHLPGGAEDFGLRLLGFCVGTAILAGFWLNARALRIRYPLLSLSLLGVNLILLFFGDSLRAYGLGCALLLATMASVWRLAEEPDAKRFLWAALAGVVMVQCLYQNAFLLAALCLAGALVNVRRGRRGEALLVLAVGVPAALSLLPYLGLIQRYQTLMAVYREPQIFAQIAGKFEEILGYPQHEMAWVWAALCLFGLGTAAAVRWNDWGGLSEDRKDVSLFSGAALIAGSASFFIFLKAANRPIAPWYLIPWMTFAAVCLDGLADAWSQKPLLRWARLAVAAALLGWTGQLAWRGAYRRQTNVDLVASKLKTLVQKEDLVVVNPWYYGISFDRYYDGDAPWTTIPPLDDHSLSRYDLILEQMAAPSSPQALESKVESVLRGGHRVWLVGYYTAPSALPTPWPPPTSLPTSAAYDAYLGAWEEDLLRSLLRHAARVEKIPSVYEGFVNPIEKLNIASAEGWR